MDLFTFDKEKSQEFTGGVKAGENLHIALFGSFDEEVTIQKYDFVI